MQSRPIIALIGRPNVGKSTIFNRLIGRRQAITSFQAGTTRDRHFGMFEWLGHSWSIVDTAGIMIDDTASEQEELDLAIDEQIKVAIAEADVLCFVVDVKEGLHPEDKAIVNRLRKENKPLIVLVNKADNQAMRVAGEVFQQFGVQPIIPVSAVHGSGFGDLLDYLVENFPYKSEDVEPSLPRISIIGRPNVGKSTLINQLLGEKRLVVSNVPGTTRDSIETTVTLPDGQQLLFVDTAGIRRRGKIEAGLEKFSLFRTLKTVNYSDIVLLVLTIEEAPTRGDAHVAMYAMEANKKIIVVLNKADLAYDNLFKQDNHKRHNVGQKFLRRFAFMQRMPFVFVSAETGQGVDDLIKEIQAIAPKKRSV